METSRAHLPATLPWVKGHATENDFVVLPDPDDQLRLDTSLVRALCDRRRGLGADGVLRVVRAGPGGAWCMEHWNADGTRAEMCGNGARLYGRYLVQEGWVEPGAVLVETLAGRRRLEVPAEGDVRVEMGRAALVGEVTVGSALGTLVDLGNPHAVVEVRSLASGGRLEGRPDLNVEYVERLGERHLRMRVVERGVGETRSCGTGACAAVAAVGGEVGSHWRVDVPGGRLQVDVGEQGLVLGGAAVLVARGHLVPSELLADGPVPQVERG